MGIGQQWTQKNEPSGTSTLCSYCGSACEHSFFSAFSIDTKSAMCGECIERYAVLSRLGKLRMMYSLSKGKWSAFFKLIKRETNSVKATPEVREKALFLIRLLVRRASSIVAGYKAEGYEKDPNDPTINFAQPKIKVSLKEAEIDSFCKIVKKGLAFAGLPLLVTDVEQTNQSILEDALGIAMRDPKLMEHVCVLVRDGERDMGTPGPMVFIDK